MKVAWHPGSSCSASDLDDFHRLVRAGNEVEPEGLKRRILRAERLVVAREGGAVLGVAALKNPAVGYSTEVFAKAEASGPERFRLELGWVFVVPGQRGRGISTRLVESALEDVNRCVFATSWIDNAAMHRSLERHGFRRVGRSYLSLRSARTLALFVREGSSVRVGPA